MTFTFIRWSLAVSSVLLALSVGYQLCCEWRANRVLETFVKVRFDDAPKDAAIYVNDQRVQRQVVLNPKKTFNVRYEVAGVAVKEYRLKLPVAKEDQ